MVLALLVASTRWCRSGQFREMPSGAREAAHASCPQLPSTPASHSARRDQRRRPVTFFTAIAIAFGWPTRTTSFRPRVTPV